MANTFALSAFFALVLAVAGGIVALSAFIGRRPLNEACLKPYECGLDPQGTPRRPFAIKYFLIAILFITLTAQVFLLFPLAAVYRQMIDNDAGFSVFAILAIFLAVIAIGLVYAWRAGAWEGQP